MLSSGLGEGEGSLNAETSGDSAASCQKKQKIAYPLPRAGKKNKTLALKKRPGEVALDILGKELTPEGSMAIRAVPVRQEPI